MQYAAVLLKPDAVRDRLESHIEQELRNAGCEILLRKYWNVQTKHIQIVHPDLSMDDLCLPYIQRNYSSFPSLVLLVQYDGTEEIHEYLRKLKGDPEKPESIRYRYRISTNEWGETNLPSSDCVDRRTVENRIHAPDNLQETIAVLRCCLTLGEMRSLPQILQKEVLRL